MVETHELAETKELKIAATPLDQINQSDFSYRPNTMNDHLLANQNKKGETSLSSADSGDHTRFSIGKDYEKESYQSSEEESDVSSTYDENADFI